MNKLINILGALTLSTSAATAFSHAAPKQSKIEKNNLQIINNKKWITKQINPSADEVFLSQENLKEGVVGIFDNIEKQVKFKNLSLNNSIKKFDNQQLLSYIELAKKESLKILQEINEKNIITEEIVPYLRNQSNIFDQNYQSEITKFNTINLEKNLNFKSPSYALQVKSYVTQSELIEKLKTARIVLITASTATAVVAAGFAAAAFFTFGATLPWATGTTAASTALGIAAAGLQEAIVKLEEVRDFTNGVFSSTKSTVKKILLVLDAALLAVTAFTPPGLTTAAIAIITGTLAWLEYVNVI